MLAACAAAAGSPCRACEDWQADCPQEKCWPVIHGARAQGGSQHTVTMRFLFPARQQLHHGSWQQAFGGLLCGTLGICKSDTALRSATLLERCKGSKASPSPWTHTFPPLPPALHTRPGGSFSYQSRVGHFWVILSMLCSRLLEDYLK